ncbi:MoxR family ATPase [Akkermansiaceae bacterium]|nr:MoxR family ATPase [Akkermansiaceae bacterium]MDB4295602.1 MoxR family ATPase [Akkermansiaceae bacterium]MDB4323137.1 MoxR family ATPase [Akkermansiaceae bacterium]MDB4467506.1 MoxR family ATPase [Akkermansiaceae bacterium]MDB4569942.1 MoxR family ATPase [Akkermansiaceae bacterium]
MTENEEIPPTETPDLAAVTGLANRLREEVSRVVFGQDETVAQVVAALLAGGHVLLEGKPGLGKTHMVLALASTFGGDFGRIQFTPDMMPSDITGFTLFDMKSQTFQTRRGPVFTNLLLADEINRAPAKTQAALLEVMQEQQVTIDGESLPVAPPFMCFATQNPIEQEGTYPLPEAQLDRFLIKVVIDYPTLEDELRVVSEVTAQAGGKGVDPKRVEQVCDSQIIIEAQRLTALVKVVPEVIDYAIRLTRYTREAPGLSLGAGTRGAISLVQLAKSYAVIAGRDYVIPDDVKRATLPVFRHRVQVAPEVAISGQNVDDLLTKALESVEAPRT